MKNEYGQRIKQHVQEQFGKHADKYVTSSSHAKGDDLALIHSWLQPQSDWIVLDIATGGGHVAKQLSPHVQHVIATDLTPPMLGAAAGHLKKAQCGNVTFVVADAEQLPFLDDSFDAVTCRIAAHHFPHPDKFLQEAARVLKPGRKFIFIDNIAPEDEVLGHFMNAFETMRDTSHVRCLSVNEWTSLAMEAGLQVEQSVTSRKQHHFPVWVRRTAENEEQIKNVEQFIAEADPTFHQYFSVLIEDGGVQSLQIDEWRALMSKPASYTSSI
ncbi:class I SAM-dependent methyltransferase [Paenibacillus sedimenti]|uniref:Class I SAM-dependent methyltransferase n=1 Tax=Paenibacillus sedimenti TaxID=2770274 RepID=A0A926KN67_9BACL|nr:methyltransferase domain-containing protein [Paenibacillus sedimenti]MBD0380790.1 class I SAM-dependent methyltransferase [Paenibacillus sedimenti]